MSMAADPNIKQWLDQRVDWYNVPAFIETDPIQVPHRFHRKEDVEVAAFFTASIAWGNRTMIIKNATRLMELMNFQPFSFLMDATLKDWDRLSHFRHRTFGGADCLWFAQALRNIYLRHDGLEQVFTSGFLNEGSVYSALRNLREHFLLTPSLPSSLRHISDVCRGSAAKRLNLFLMWMVRQDGRGVHFGLWKGIPMSKLMIPLDVHLGRVSRRLGLLSRRQDDWKAVVELTENLREFDANDPVRYDFALFGSGVFEKDQHGPGLLSL